MFFYFYHKEQDEKINTPGAQTQPCEYLNYSRF